MVVAVGEAEDIGQSLLSDGRVGGHRRHDRQAAVRVNLLAREHDAAIHVANHCEHARIIAERLGGGLSFLCVRLIVDHLRHDLSAENAARCIPLVDCEIDRLTHLDAESRRGGRQRTGDADANFLAGEISRADGDRRGSQRRGEQSRRI